MKRFKTVECNIQDDNGEWVSYDDHVTEVERLQKMIADYADHVELYEGTDCLCDLEFAEEIKGYREKYNKGEI